ncbi:1405_t:CDS:1 [Acaulospora morrowiae]|uniref:1405_t:CDS:1 n=1 Tax=Acaulospora morrowiae TaxID=94023 RepID=A0A9N8W0E4_9GLOM|nr:1405_t:CDS:1 [Acaulospora morrowiae]
MASLKSFNFHLVFLTLFLLAFVQANYAEEEESFTQEFIRENKELITKFTLENSYLNEISNGTIQDSAFKHDLIGYLRWFTLWAKSFGYVLAKVPVPPPEDWNFGDVPPEFLLNILVGAMNDVQGYISVFKGIAANHGIDIYSEPTSELIKADTDELTRVGKSLPIETWIARNWVGVRFTYEGFLIVQENIKKGKYNYAFQDYIDVFTSPRFNATVTEIEFLTNTIYKSKKSNRNLATTVLRKRLESLYEIMAENVK